MCHGSVLLEEWLREIGRCVFDHEGLPTKFAKDCRHLRPGLKIQRYHGRSRENDRLALADADIVLSTYHTVAMESTKSDSALFRVKWFRIVLDEGQTSIKMSSSASLMCV